MEDTTNNDMDDIKEVIKTLAKGMCDLKIVKVPPPNVYKGFEDSVQVEVFFEIFERHCRSVYQDAKESWLQVLPSFLTGEGKALAHAYGLTTPYDTVKLKLIEKFQARSRLDQGDINDIFSAVRRAGESFEVFSIRLEMLANRWTTASEEVRRELVRARFLDLLELPLRNKVQLHFGSNTGITPLPQIIAFVTIAENQSKQRSAGKLLAAAALQENHEGEVTHTEEAQMRVITGARPKTAQKQREGQTNVCEHCNLTGHTIENCRRKLAKCYRCRKAGHFARDCPTEQVGRNDRNNPGKDRLENKRCPVCGREGHAPWQCEDVWRRFLSCQCCGSWNHATFQCDRQRAPPNYGTAPVQQQRALQPPGN